MMSPLDRNPTFRALGNLFWVLAGIVMMAGGIVILGQQGGSGIPRGGWWLPIGVLSVAVGLALVWPLNRGGEPTSHE